MQLRRLLVFLVAITALAGCGGPPSASDILKKPDQSNLRDAHFTLTAHIASGNLTIDATGSGNATLKPKQAFHFSMQASVAGQPLTFEQITVDGKDYQKTSPGPPRWLEKASASSSGPSSFNGTDAKLIGEEDVAGGRAWHVRAKDKDGNPFDAWVRESDGYPLKYSGTSQGSSFTFIFDGFNTGTNITAPPASEVQAA